MIEVEKKFHATKSAYDFLSQQCEFVAEKKIHDIYFDNPDFELMLSNRWLRLRNGIWEMKVPTPSYSTEIPTYNEIFEPEIILELSLPSEKLTMEFLAAAGYVPQLDFTSLRKKYKYQNCLLDLDRTDFGLEVLEIERMVSEEGEVEEAKESILRLAGQIDPEMKQNHVGKVRYLMIEKHPEIDKKMIENGIVDEARS